MFAFRGLCLSIAVALFATSAAADQIVNNGSFEDPQLPSGTPWQVLQGLPGWTARKNYIEVQTAAIYSGPFAAPNGRQFIEVDAPGAGPLLEQGFPTSTDFTYTLKLKYAARPGAGKQSLGILWRGRLIAELNGTSNDPAQIPSFKEYTFKLNAAEGRSVLSFEDIQSAKGAGNLVDDVRIFRDPINLVKNASFEEDKLASLPNSHGGLWANVSTIKKWVLPLRYGEIQSPKIYPGSQAADGNQFLEVDGPANSVEYYQNIPTKIGRTYKVQFSYSPRPGVKSQQLFASASHGFTNDALVHVGGDGSALTVPHWQTVTFQFKAASTTTRIAFGDDFTSSQGAGNLLDNVSVTAVP